ncbi:5833_t:CDS:2, partial [Funneliformis mosseae]
MDEKADKRVHKTFQDAVALFLDNLYHKNEGFRGNGTSRPEKILFKMLIVLANKITMMNMKSSHRSST